MFYIHKNSRDCTQFEFGVGKQQHKIAQRKLDVDNENDYKAVANACGRQWAVGESSKDASEESSATR